MSDLRCLVFHEGNFYKEAMQYPFDPADLPHKAYICTTVGDWYVNHHKKPGMAKYGAVKIPLKFVPKELRALVLLLT